MRQEATARVVQPNEGEQLELRNGRAVIKVDPTMGSPRLAMGTQVLRAGAGVPVHTHENADEIVFVHGGKGVVIVGDERKHIQAGTTVYVPQESCMASRIQAKACNSFGSSPPLVWRISFVKQAGRPVENPRRSPHNR